MVNYDTVLTSIGGFGLYQKRLSFVVLLLTIPIGVHITSVVFNNITPEYRCAIPGLKNDSYTLQDSQHESLVQAFIPKGKDGERYSHCEIYNVAKGLPQAGKNTTHDCQRWVYDETDSTMSQIVQYDLVCDKVMYKAHNNLIVLLGILIGSLIGGPISDFFGRKKTTIVSLVISCVFGAVMAGLPSISLVMVCRFLTVAASIIQWLSAYVLLIETVDLSNRRISISAMMGFTIGTLVDALVQYLFRDWRIAQLVVSLSFMTLGFCWWLIPESPRWLLAKNRREEAMEVISEIARVNKGTLPEEIEFLDDPTISKSKDEKSYGNVDTTSGSRDVKIWHLCTSRRYVFYLIILCFSWATINMVFYGLLLGVGDLIDGDIYINFVLQSSMEIASHVLCFCIVERMGRKKIFCSTMMITGLATLGIGVLILVDQDIRWLSIFFYCLGKLCIAIGFNLIYIITSELLPTKIRNSGLGFCSCVARFSGIVSPYIVSASLLIPGPFGKAFPVLLFGIFSSASGLSAMLLPETRNTKLPETFDDESDDSDL